ncbi:MAG: endonuclease/exonuclease/phosphatase family protein [Geminicoccaceae bacterium]|nr:endonuclease/exonuclease/phosphatase family protein [Geminicoccaceae bacterium]HRY25372.1 endonuclease/exonuclease/phosphatase family protein [Geminicoccaceae bacterium]
MKGGSRSRLGLALLLGVWAVAASLASCSPDGADLDRQALDVPATCADLAERGSLRVLTLNLHFSAIRERPRRLETISDFIAAEGVDVALLQEAVGGVLSGSRNSARDLRDALSDRHGLAFDLRTAVEDGVPGVLTVANAILSRCAVLEARTAALPEIAELEVLGHRFRLGRNVVMARLLVPKIGEISVYNTHLCARCTADQRRRQLVEALAFIGANEEGGGRPVIFGGDLNLDLHGADDAERALYGLMAEAGLRDAASAVTGAVGQLCAQPARPDAYCTVGVAEPTRPHSKRIDYLFARDFGGILAYRTVFNPRLDPTQTAVSNHAGVMVELDLTTGRALARP